MWNIFLEKRLLFKNEMREKYVLNTDIYNSLFIYRKKLYLRLVFLFLFQLHNLFLPNSYQ